MRSQMPSHATESAPTNPLRAVNVADPDEVVEAIRVALDGGAAVLPFSSQHSIAVERLCAEHPVVDGDIALLIRTSGTTGEPKAVALSRSALRASAVATQAALGGAGQWLVALSPEVIAGAQMLVRSIVAGEQPIFCLGQFRPERFIEAAQTLTAERRYTSLVPVQLTRLLEHVEANPAGGEDARAVLARFDAVLLGGQAAPNALVDHARALGINIVRTYGSTETASGCVYEGQAVGDTELRFQDGELRVAGSSLAAGYLDDAALTADRFVLADGRRWFRTHDTAELVGGKLRVTGRVDNVFVSGGVKVSVDELERFITGLEGWHEAVVLARDDETWGQRAEVCVVGASPSFESMQDAVRIAFGPAWVPTTVHELTQMPLLASGKPDRATLVALIS